MLEYSKKQLCTIVSESPLNLFLMVSHSELCRSTVTNFEKVQPDSRTAATKLPVPPCGSKTVEPDLIQRYSTILPATTGGVTWHSVAASTVTREGVTRGATGGTPPLFCTTSVLGLFG